MHARTEAFATWVRDIQVTQKGLLCMPTLELRAISAPKFIVPRQYGQVRENVARVRHYVLATFHPRIRHLRPACDILVPCDSFRSLAPKLQSLSMQSRRFSPTRFQSSTPYFLPVSELPPI